MAKVNKTMNGFEDGPGRNGEGREIDCSCSSRREWTKRRRRTNVLVLVRTISRQSAVC